MKVDKHAEARPHSPTGGPDFVHPQPMEAEPVVVHNSYDERTSDVPVALLIEELAKEDIQVRLNSVRQIGIIAAALGPQRTRNELVPYIKDMIDDEDDVLSVISDQLLTLIPHIGGKEHLSALLPPYECLLVVEESRCRKQAIENVQKLLSQMDDFTEAYQMVLRLSNSDWHTARISGASLTPVIFARSGASEQAELLNLFILLAKDTMPMVRRAVVHAIADLAPLVQPDRLRADLLPAFLKLSKDDQDSVRLICVETMCQLKGLFSPDEIATHLHVVVRTCCLDASWRVRYVAADKFDQLADLLGPQLTKERLLPIYATLLKDAEAEVRSVAASKMAKMLRRFGEDKFIEKILPVIPDIVEDTSKFTRAAFANSVMELFTLLQKDILCEKVLPNVLKLLKDEFPTVRLNVISNLSGHDMNLDLAILYESLQPAIKELAMDKNWRVRLSVIERTPALAEKIGSKFFDPPMGGLLMSWLRDPISTVRDAAASNLQAIGNIFGSEWILTVLIPAITPITQPPHNYLVRMTAINAYCALSPLLMKSEMAPIQNSILALCLDLVPNVRLRACQALQHLHQIDRIENMAEAIKALTACVNDEDIDVRYFATQVKMMLMS